VSLGLLIQTSTSSQKTSTDRMRANPQRSLAHWRYVLVPNLCFELSDLKF